MFRSVGLIALAVSLFVVAATPPVWSSERAALPPGNGAYADATALPSAPPDRGPGMTTVAQSQPAAPQPAAPAPAAVIGNWELEWKGAMDSYTGKLSIERQIAASHFEGKLFLKKKSDGARIEQKADIVITGDQATIICSNPTRKKYNPDRFYLTYDGKTMTGTSKDTRGAVGQSIVLTKN